MKNTIKRILTESVMAQAMVIGAVVYPIASIGWQLASPVAN